MFNFVEVREPGKMPYTLGEQPAVEHNRKILTRIVEEYLYNIGKLESIYSEEYNVPVCDVAPYGQVMFARSKDLNQYVGILEQETGTFLMERIIQKVGADMSETEAKARRILACWNQEYNRSLLDKLVEEYLSKKRKRKTEEFNKRLSMLEKEVGTLLMSTTSIDPNSGLNKAEVKARKIVAEWK